MPEWKKKSRIQKIRSTSSPIKEVRCVNSRARCVMMSLKQKKIKWQCEKTIKLFQNFIEFPNLIGPSSNSTASASWAPSRMMSSHVPRTLTVKKRSDISSNDQMVLANPHSWRDSQAAKMQMLLSPEVSIGYYSQDFDALDMNMTVWDSLHSATSECTDQDVYKVAAQFLLIGDLLKNPVYALSEGQKGLLCYARFILQKPHLLILDEPTNHINFRHLPVIAEALNTTKVVWSWWATMMSLSRKSKTSKR
jgi:ABC-type sugar transport system ATPase subunit